MSGQSPSPASLAWSGVTARRMARHALTEPASDLGPADIAGVMCGAHAQVLSAAELSIGRRIAGATRADVQRALWEDRTLVKTFGPRGTVHLLPAADLPMWTGALSALPSSVPMHPEPVRFTPEQAEEVIAAIGDALAEHELTVDELTEAIVERTGPWAGERTMDGVPGQVAALAPADRARPRIAACSASDRTGAATSPTPTRTAGCPASSPTTATPPCAHSSRATCTPTARPRPGTSPSGSASRRGDAVDLFDEAGGRAGAGRARRRAGLGGGRRQRDAAGAAPGHPPAALLRRLRGRRPASGAAVPGRRRQRARSARRVRPATTRWCSSTAWSAGCGTSGAPADRLAITVEPLRDLTATQRRQLDEEVELVGAVMEAVPTLTVGTVDRRPPRLSGDRNRAWASARSMASLSETTVASLSTTEVPRREGEA